MKNKNELIAVGKRVKHTRKTLKLTQEEMAKHLNISGAQVSEIENAGHPPGFYFLVNLAKEFNVNLYYLVFGEGNMFWEKLDDRNMVEDFLVVKKEIVQHFLWHFYRSPTLQHLILAHFNSIMGIEQEQIQKELNLCKEKYRDTAKKNKNQS